MFVHWIVLRLPLVQLSVTFGTFNLKNINLPFASLYKAPQKLCPLSSEFSVKIDHNFRNALCSCFQTHPIASARIHKASTRQTHCTLRRRARIVFVGSQALVEVQSSGQRASRTWRWTQQITAVGCPLKEYIQGEILFTFYRLVDVTRLGLDSLDVRADVTGFGTLPAP